MPISPPPPLTDPFPPGLRKIGIIAPSSPLDPEKFKEAEKFLLSLGKTPSFGQHVLSGASDSFFAAENEERLSDINTAIGDETLPLILCARGGYGSTYLLRDLDYGNLRKQKKILCGYSDITAIHLAMAKYQAGIGVACPMFTSLPEKLSHFSTAKSMKRALKKAWSMHEGFREEEMGFFTKLTPLNSFAGGVQTLSGKAAPMNLTLLTRLCGTPFLPDFRESFLILEEVGELPRKIDFSFLQLHLAGILENCRGIILGDYTDCGEKDALEKVFRRLAEMVSIPLWQGLPFGHGLHSASLVWGETIEVTPGGEVFLSGGETWF